MALGGFVSTYKCITFGVPQGSHIGPLLFNLYVKEITKITTFIYLLTRADDTILR